jgi:hypothetical protein
VTQELRCPECKAILPDDRSCQDLFYQMGFWEFEDLAVYGVIHHHMVLCYHLQHPNLYSQQGLRGAMQMLSEFIERDITPQDMRKHIRAQVDSANRNFKIKGTPENQGKYKDPVDWEMTAADVVAGGLDNYVENVKTWAHSVYKCLRSSGNLPAPSSSQIYGQGNS